MESPSPSSMKIWRGSMGKGASILRGWRSRLGVFPVRSRILINMVIVTFQEGVSSLYCTQNGSGVSG